MRILPRAAVPFITALALAAGWLTAPGAAAGPADPPGARHIVVLKDDVAEPDAVAKEHGRRHGAEVQGIYRHALKGYVASFKGTGASDVARDPRVDFVELDRAVSVHATPVPQQMLNGEPWGLDRIDQKARPLSGTYTYGNTGANVTAYIIDTGILYTHQELGGRAIPGFDAFTDNRNGSDCDGHGTHVAGTVGGKTYGVAKEVRLVSVRVLDCTGSGSWSGVINGIEYVTGQHDADERSVANMSLGGPASAAVDAAVAGSISDGVTYVVAAGNGNTAGIGQDACRYSPARVSGAITVGATDKADTKPKWSNYGTCVDWFAPGVGIVSAGMSATSTTATANLSGTSMAAPHAAGVAALYLSTGLSTRPADVQAALGNILSRGVVKSAGKGSPANLLFTSF